MASLEYLEDLKTGEADLAYRRLDAILRAYGIRHAAIRSAEVQRILVQAVRSHTNAEQSLESYAAEQVFRELSAGVERILQSLALDGPVDRNRVLTALRKSKVPIRHPEALLGQEPLTDAEVQDLVAIYKSQTAPALKRSSMGAPALRFESIDEMSRRIGDLIDKIPFGGQVLSYLVALVFFLLVYFFAR